MAVVNTALAVEVVRWCDELCVSWRAAVDARARLGKVKAQDYIMKFEMKLCDACVACEAGRDGVIALLGVVAEDLPRAVQARQVRQVAASVSGDGDANDTSEESGRGGLATVDSLLRLVVEASGVAKAEGWGCKDLLDAVTKDVVSFAKSVGVETRLAPTPWAPGLGSRRTQRRRRPADQSIDGVQGSTVASRNNRIDAARRRRLAGSGSGGAGGGGEGIGGRKSVHRPGDVVRIQGGGLPGQSVRRSGVGGSGYGRRGGAARGRGAARDIENHGLVLRPMPEVNSSSGSGASGGGPRSLPPNRQIGGKTRRTFKAPRLVQRGRGGARPPPDVMRTTPSDLDKFGVSSRRYPLTANPFA